MATLFHGTVMCREKASSSWDIPCAFELDDEWEKSVEEKRSGERFDYANAESALTDLQRQQISWLRENAYRYGFVIRYEEGKEHLTGKAWAAIYASLCRRRICEDHA